MPPVEKRPPSLPRRACGHVSSVGLSAEPCDACKEAESRRILERASAEPAKLLDLLQNSSFPIPPPPLRSLDRDVAEAVDRIVRREGLHVVDVRVETSGTRAVEIRIQVAARPGPYSAPDNFGYPRGYF